MEKPVELTEEQRNKSIQEFVEFTSQHVLTFFKMLGLKTHIDCQLYNEPTDERFIFRFYKVGVGYESAADTFAKSMLQLESENKALREENLRLQNRVSSLENIAEMDRKTEYQYNQLYKEKEALRDEVSTLKNEIERLKINQPPFR